MSESASEIIQRAWTARCHTLPVALSTGITPQLPVVSREASQSSAQLAEELLTSIDALDDALRPSIDEQLTLGLVKFQSQFEIFKAQNYLQVHDLVGIFVGPFSFTPYTAGFAFKQINGALKSFSEHEETADLAFSRILEQYVALVEGIHERTREQSEAGIVAPREQLAASQQLFLANCAEVSSLVDAKLQASNRAPSSSSHIGTLGKELNARHVAFCEFLENTCCPRAPLTTGMCSYAGGKEVYEELVRWNTTLPLSVAEVDERLRERLARLRERESDLGYVAGSASEESQRDISSEFARALERFEGIRNELFNPMNLPPYTVAPLPETLEDSMSFGHYQLPTADTPTGSYIYNHRNLRAAGAEIVPALAYHELMPGHHLHFCSQVASESLHPLRKSAMVNAFNEGWAEYAAELCRANGLYLDRAQEWGRIKMDTFLTVRGIVDIGLNYEGWSLERGNQFLADHTVLSEAEIVAETRRYSSDIPAQVLAYKLGDDLLWNVRQVAEQRLGDQFCQREFHDLIIGCGALPLPLVEWNVDQFIKAQQGACMNGV